MKVVKKGPSITSDAIKAALPEAVKFGVETFLKLIPANSKLEDVLKKYKNYWPALAPLISLTIERITNLSDIGDDILSGVNSEIARQLKEKYSDDEDINPVKTGKEFPLSSAMTSLTKDELVMFTGLLQALPEKQRKKLLAMEFGGKESAKEFIKILAALDEEQFKAWAEVMSPVDKPRVDSKFETDVKEGLNQFKDDAKDFFKKDSWVTSLAKKRGLM